MSKRIVALAGRPNVGKSSLFNRLVGRRKALVWDEEGVTRDLNRGVWQTDQEEIEIWDLAGFGREGISFADLTSDQKDKITSFILVLDGSEPLTPQDLECIRMIRKSKRPCVVALNKSDKKTFAYYSSEIFKEASFDTVSISAEQASGIDELEKVTLSFATIDRHETAHEQSGEKGSRILILGRPNVGKSSLLNAMAGETISYVSSQPGTTRDPIETTIQRRKSIWTFCDTAGIRKKARIYKTNEPVEIFSAQKALQELKTARVVVFLIEATATPSLHSQDKKLMKLIRESKLPFLVVVNKWDLVRKQVDEKEYRQYVKDFLGDLAYAPITFVSAKTGFRLDQIYRQLEDLISRQKKISTSKLNAWLQDLLEKKTFRVAKFGTKGRSGRSPTQYLTFYYMTQTSEVPMSFQVFCNAPHAVAEADRSFFENQIRKTFHLVGLPIHLTFRRRHKRPFFDTTKIKH